MTTPTHGELMRLADAYNAADWDYEPLTPPKEREALSTALTEVLAERDANALDAAKWKGATAVCIHALRSYQYGNGSGDLAKEVADKFDAAMKGQTHD